MFSGRAIIPALMLVLLPAGSPAEQVTLYPSDDADVWEYSPDDNRGDKQYFQVGCGGSGFRRNSLIKFDVSSISGAVVNSATIRLMVVQSWGDFPTDELYLALHNDDWEEMTVTWNNRPAYADTMPIAAPSEEFEWWEIDVTDWIQSMAYGIDPNYGFQIYQSDTDYAGFGMRTKEGTVPPELVVDYSQNSFQAATFAGIKALFR
ncbi:MAG: DNRLRE domain-containing protein [Candidatus Fermentibacteraceae bacterium]